MTALLDVGTTEVAAALERTKNSLRMRQVHDVAQVLIAAGWTSQDAYDAVMHTMAGMRLLAEIKRRS